MQTTISLETYDIVIGPIRNSLSEYLKYRQYSKIVVVVDEHTVLECLPKIESHLPHHSVIQIRSGEIHKTLEICTQIWTEMAEAKLDRHSLLINLGGGVIGDMGGFAAACYMRGIDFIQIPTTLLSQVDASVGGKLAVDFKGYKNFIGLFQNPQAVLIDPDFLLSLPPRELRSGFAEMIKHGLIRDEHIWNRFVQAGENWKNLDLEKEIHDSVLIKKDVVNEDPKEMGLRKILNFGHTIGHSVESLALSTQTPLLHGEAIALGMMTEAVLSANHVGLAKESAHRITQYLSGVYADLDISILREHAALIPLMQSDKKNKSGAVLFSLLTAEGACTFDINVDKEDICRGLEETYQKLVDI